MLYPEDTAILSIYCNTYGIVVGRKCAHQTIYSLCDLRPCTQWNTTEYNSSSPYHHDVITSQSHNSTFENTIQLNTFKTHFLFLKMILNVRQIKMKTKAEAISNVPMKVTYQSSTLTITMGVPSGGIPSTYCMTK